MKICWCMYLPIIQKRLDFIGILLVLFIGQMNRIRANIMMRVDNVSYLIPASRLVRFRLMVRADGRAGLIIKILLAIHILVFNYLISSCALMAAIYQETIYILSILRNHIITCLSKWLMRPLKLEVAKLQKYTGIFFMLIKELLVAVRINVVKLFVKQIDPSRVELNA